jgi:hypothetical protein
VIAADRCFVCNKTLAEVGGQRIVFTHVIAVRINGNDIEVVGVDCSLEALARAGEQFRAGQRPWLCQRCSNVALCHECGEPFPRCPGADVLYDDGSIWHVPFVAGMGLRCAKCDGSIEEKSQ